MFSRKRAFLRGQRTEVKSSMFSGKRAFLRGQRGLEVKSHVLREAWFHVRRSGDSRGWLCSAHLFRMVAAWPHWLRTRHHHADLSDTVAFAPAHRKAAPTWLCITLPSPTSRPGTPVPRALHRGLRVWGWKGKEEESPLAPPQSLRQSRGRWPGHPQKRPDWSLGLDFRRRVLLFHASSGSSCLA